MTRTTERARGASRPSTKPRHDACAAAAAVPAAPPPAASPAAGPALAPPPLQAEDLLLEARRSLTLRCGKSSITLHANGKIVLRGEYILSDAEGVNRIAGGQIELN